MEQKFLITDNQNKVQSLLDEGWKIISVTAQRKGESWTGGYFAIVLERMPHQKIFNDPFGISKDDSVFK